MRASNWTIRPARGSDLNFLYSTWLNSYRCDSSLGRSTKKSVFFAQYYGVLDAIFEKPGTATLVACLPDDESVILSFLVFGPGVVHYCFTKQSFRRLGIARSLFEAARERGLGAGAVEYSHKTRHAALIVDTRQDFTYNPFLLFSRFQTETDQKDDKNG
jgi:GNAT superfamily N-acetyltransferase